MRSGRTYEDEEVGEVPPMMLHDDRTEQWMRDHHDPLWRAHLAEALA